MSSATTRSGARRRGDGGLEQGLRRQFIAATEVPGSPFLTRDEAAGLLATAAEVRRQRSALRAGHPLVYGTAEAVDELDDVVKKALLPTLRRTEPATAERQLGIRNMLDGHWAEWKVALDLAWHGDRAALKQYFRLDEKDSVEVDVVTGGGSRWIQVKAYSNPFGLGSTSWDDVRKQARQTVRAAAQNPVEGRTPDVTYAFHNGVSQEVARALRDMGLGVRGKIIEPPSKQREEWLWTR